MQFVLVLTHERDPAMVDWPSDARTAHDEYLDRLADELVVSGELVDRRHLAPPSTGHMVAADGVNPPLVREWPYDEGPHPLEGYWLVDVADRDRALVIAGRLSAAPGPRGRPLRRAIEVRAVE